MFAVTEHRHHDPTALGGVAHGVAHEIDDALCDHVGIGFDDIVVTLGLVSKAQAQIAVDKQALLGIDDGTHERNHVHRLKVERSRAVFHAR